MDLSSLKVAQEWSAIYPELTLGLLALGLLVLEIVLPRRLHAVIPRIAVSGQVALLVFILCFDRLGEFNGKTSFGGLLAHDGTGVCSSCSRVPW
jgi:NADH-quinone oxidoreductase subunit N